MTQMEYITLKTPEGQLVGHARVREGAVSIHLREPMEGQAAVFTPSGAKLGPLGMTMQFQEPVLGVALLDRGRMAAWGAGRNGNLTPGRMEEQLRGAGNPLGMTARAGTPERARPEPSEVREGAGEPIAKPEQSLRQEALFRGIRIKRPRPKGIKTGEEYQRWITADPEDPTNRALSRAESRVEGETPASLRQGEFAYMAGTEEREPAQRRADRQRGTGIPDPADPVQQRELSHQAGLDAAGGVREGTFEPPAASPEPEALRDSVPQSAQAYERQITADPEDPTNRAVSRAEGWAQQEQELARAPRDKETKARDQVIAFESIGAEPKGPGVGNGNARTYEIRFQTGMAPRRVPTPGGQRWQESARPPVVPPIVPQGDPEEIRPSRFPVGTPGPGLQTQQAMETAAGLVPNPEVTPPVAPLPPLSSEELSGEGSNMTPGDAGAELRENGQTLGDPDTEAFFALLRRSEEVYRSIAEPALAQPPEVQPVSNMDGAQAEPLPFARQGGHTSWQGEVNRILQRDREDRQPVKNPFPHIFPNAAFYQVTKGGVLQGLLGEWQQGGERILIHAVPGAYHPVPPAHLSDYTRFIRSRAGGFWVKLEGEGEKAPN